MNAIDHLPRFNQVAAFLERRPALTILATGASLLAINTVAGAGAVAVATGVVAAGAVAIAAGAVPPAAGGIALAAGVAAVGAGAAIAAASVIGVGTAVAIAGVGAIAAGTSAEAIADQRNFISTAAAVSVLILESTLKNGGSLILGGALTAVSCVSYYVAARFL